MHIAVIGYTVGGTSSAMGPHPTQTVFLCGEDYGSDGYVGLSYQGYQQG